MPSPKASAKRRDVLRLAGLAGLGFMPVSAAPMAGKAMSEKDAKLTREAFGDLRIYFEGATEQVKSMTAGSLRLKPGMEPHPPHQHPEEEFLLITEGSGEVMVEGKSTAVGPGAMLYCGANRMHHIRNTGKTPLLFYFYKWQA